MASPRNRNILKTITEITSNSMLDDHRFDRELIWSLVACLFNRKFDEIAEVASWFKPRYLVDSFHQDMYTAIVNLAAQRAPATDTSLTRALHAVSTKHKCVAEFAKMIQEWRTIWWYARWYAQQVYLDWVRRSAANEAGAASKELLRKAADPQPVLQRLGTLETKYAPQPRTRVTDNSAVLHEIMNEIENPEKVEETSISTGLSDVDDLLGPIRPGSLVVVGARTSDGKSSFVGHVAAHIVFTLQRRALVFSIEMSNKECYKRWACWLSRRQAGRSREFIEALSRLQVAADQHKTLQLCAGNRTIGQIETEARAYARVAGLSLVVVDYLGQVTPNLSVPSREQQIADMSRRLKALSMECGVPLLVAAQLNRQATKEGPKIHHLRDSGAIEQDADVVILLEPEDSDSSTKETKIIVVKNRHGRKGVSRVVWHSDIFRYDDVAPQRYSEFDDYNAAGGP